MVLTIKAGASALLVLVDLFIRPLLTRVESRLIVVGVIMAAAVAVEGQRHQSAAHDNGEYPAAGHQNPPDRGYLRIAKLDPATRHEERRQGENDEQAAGQDVRSHSYEYKRSATRAKPPLPARCERRSEAPQLGYTADFPLKRRNILVT